MRENLDHSTHSRRRFLQMATMGVSSSCLTSCLCVAEDSSQAGPHSGLAKPAPPTCLAEHLWVFHGPINVGILRDGQKAILIDCGDGSVASVLPELGITTIDQLLFTHHHRDQACGAHKLLGNATRVVVPEAERAYFDNVGSYWKDPKNRWHIYNQHPHHLMLCESLRVDRACAEGSQWTWGPAKISVLATPGHTDGAISYLVEVDGKRIVFCGDAIYDDGQVWDLHSLQKGTQTSDYHGFLGARPQLQKSLDKIKQAKPDLLVPAHGRVTSQPAKAIDHLLERLDRCYDSYVAISALRHYFPNMFQEYAGRKDHMAIRPGKPVPGCLRHIGTTWVLISKDKAAFVMDCGAMNVIEEINRLLAEGTIERVEGLWITHYHDDHVDAIPAFQKAFDCPCITDAHVAQVVSDPLAWRLPCISPSRCRVDRATKDGDSWSWHEFKLSAFHFPGQTLYHAGLLVEGEGLKMFFAGDSFTMAGIDDYCTQNRNWLGRDVGFDRCLALFEKLQPSHIFNCHVDDAFDFTPQQVGFMRANLAQREGLYGQLLPWDHANYGMDESWVRCHPYEQPGKAGSNAELRVVITNHSARPQTARCRAVLPKAWNLATPDWSSTTISAKTEAEIRLVLTIPALAEPHRYVIPIDVHFGPRILPQFTEAIVVV